ncbi:MAG: hypothetical protein HZA90_16040 [Verrucomicrobia bacterium]|nr:hypothetical protein [Verrucomicrobiota bacterium]
MKRILNLILLPMAFLGLVLTQTGCKTVARENIISTINTGIGITLSENPRTELYEVKAGFIRDQFYSVPTGKKVEGTGQSNAANWTPEVVSGIRAHSGAEHLFIGMDVAENFAVGAVAVQSEAATAMYIANAKNSESAKAAAGAVDAQANMKRQQRTKIAIQGADLASHIDTMTDAQLQDAGKKATEAGLFEADYLKAFLKKDPAERKTLLKDALDGEGTQHLEALQRFKTALGLK